MNNEEPLKKWVESMSEEIKALLFKENCTIQIEGCEIGNRETSIWKKEQIEVSIDDGNKKIKFTF